ncbi:MAG: ribonucleoside-triphosphate reductase [Actinobacteria bacterium]|nr:ribonucleoside-triphosphate reductase [Actinomycetota bacterium]
MDIKSELLEIGKKLPQPFEEITTEIFSTEFVVAERKAFLTRQTLTYKARLGIHDDKKEVTFFEILKESGAGISTGSIDDMSPGFGFKAQKTRIGLDGTREGNIKEQSILFGKKYQYNFNFEKIREQIKNIAEKYSYKFIPIFSERNV